LPFSKKVENVYIFKSFEEAMKTLPLDQILPNVKTVEDGIEIYKKYVSIDTQNKFGVMLIQLV